MPQRRRPGRAGAMPPKGRGPSNRRGLAPVLFVLAVVLVGIAARLVWIQGVEASTLSKMAERQRVREIVVSPKRGSIFDREGEPLAIRSDARTIYAVPHLVKDATATANALAGVLGGDPAAYAKRLQRSSSFVYIARKADMQRAQAVERLKLAGIGQLDDSRRTYPSGELACQVLGFVGVDDKGLSGIESQYDALLAGTPGRVLAERDRYGRVIPGGLIEAEDPVDGSDITLTIDKDIQYQAHLELANAVQQFGAKAGSVVVMDPNTGEVYAMASWPYFNPNEFSKADPKAFRNRVVQDAYEPGSTIKSFTAAAVIDQGLYAPDSVLGLPPTLQVADRTIHEAHPRGAVSWTLTEIVTKSSNIGAVKLGLALGKERLYDYFAKFGLTQRTGIDFPAEAKGSLPAPSAWSPSSIGNIPFGQGISVSVVQLARAYAAIANGGKLVTPHLLLRASGDATVPVWQVTEVLKPEALAETRSILKQVVKDGTGEAAAVAGYEVAGKTGTAQKAKGGKYAEGAYISSFAGFLPADDPKVLVVVTLDEPTKAIYGGTVAAPCFSRVAQFAVNHLKVPPTYAVAPAAEAGNGAVATPATGGTGQPSVLESSSPSR